MKIDELAQVDFTHFWITTTKQGAIGVVEKDPLPFRWLKLVFYIFSFGMIDVYAHRRIPRFTQAFWDHFQMDYPIHPGCRELYIEVITNVRNASTHLGKESRELLDNLRERITTYYPPALKPTPDSG